MPIHPGQLPLNWERPDGYLIGILREKSGELRVQEDNGKDLRQWRVEPQDVSEDELISIIDRCNSEGAEWRQKIWNEFSRLGLRFVEVPYW